MHSWKWRPGRYLAGIVLLAAIYFVAGRLSLLAALADQAIPPVWIPSGIALAWLLVWGYRFWPGVWLGAFLVDLSIGQPSLVAAGIAGGATLEPVLAVYLLRLAGVRSSLERVADVLGLVILGAVLSTAASATIGVGSLVLGGALPAAGYVSTWWVWWAGNAMGVLLVAPFLLTWMTPPRPAWRLERSVEMGVLLSLLMIVGLSVYGRGMDHETSHTFTYAIFPFVVWGALRFGPRGAATAIGLMAAIMIVNTARGLGPFAGQVDARGWMFLDGFLLAASFTGMLLAALLSERKRTEEALRESEEQYRHLFDSNPHPMWVYDLETLAFLAVNDAAIHHYGYSRDEFLGMTIKDIHSPEAIDSLIQAVHGVTGVFRRPGIWKQKKKDGSATDIEITTHDIVFAGKPARLVLANDVTERVRAERELRFQAQLLKAVGQAVIVIDLGGSILYWNRAAEQLYGWPASEVLGRDLQKLGLESAASEQAAEIMARLWAGEAWSGEFLVRRRDGTTFPALVTDTPVYGERGELVAIIGVSTDISERKRAEEELRREKELFRAVVDNAPIMLGFPEPDGTLTWANRAFERILGWPLKEILAPDALEKFYPDPEYRQYVLDFIRKSEGVWGDFKTCRRDGTFLHTTWANIRLSDGFNIGIGQDITERVRAQEALQETTQTLQALVQASPLAIYTLKPDGKVGTLWNPAAERMFGWSEQEVLGRPLPSVPEDKQSEFAALRQRVLSGEALANVEVRRQKRDGSLVHVSLSTAPLRDRQGNIVEIMSLAADVSERVRAEEEIRRRNRELAGLLSVGQRLTSRLELDDLVRVIPHSIVETLPSAETASLWLYDAGRDALVGRAAAGQGAAILTDLPLSPHASLVGWVYRNRQPILVDDAGRDGAFESMGWPKLNTVRSVVGVPLLIDERALGALFIDSHSRPGAFAPDDVRLLQSLASQVAVAIENARLFEQVRAGGEQLRELAGYLQTAREDERTAIAREIHDELGQALTALKIDLAWLAKRLFDEQDELKDKATGMSQLIDDTIQIVRRMSTEMRPGLLDDLGLAAAVEWQAQEFSERMGMACELHLDEDDLLLDRDPATALFRILQEALTNVARHAQASQVRVDLEGRADEVVLVVQDNGVGITPEQIADRHSLGLIGMRERARFWGGQVTFEGAAGRGTAVTARMPQTRAPEGCQ